MHTCILEKISRHLLDHATTFVLNVSTVSFKPTFSRSSRRSSQEYAVRLQHKTATTFDVCVEPVIKHDLLN